MGVVTDADLRRPGARRVRTPSWRDPRLLVGLVLVLGAALTGGLLAARADDTVPVLVTTAPLVRGDLLADAGLQVARARLDEVPATYVVADGSLPADAVALRSVGEGELLPRSAVGRLDELDSRPVGVPWQGPRPEGLAPGAAVDVWVAPREGSGRFGRPELVVRAAPVAAVVEGSAGLGLTSGTQVQVVLEPDGVAAVLAALAAEDRVDLVLVPGAGG